MRRMFAVLITSLVPALGVAAPAAAPPQITHSVQDDDERDLGVVGLETSGLPYCSGTLIAPRVVLTAAHCVVGHSPARVFVGTVPGVDGEAVAVTGVRVEPSFDRSSLRGDVATLLLERAVDARSWPILASEDAAALDGAQLRLVGFGRASLDDVAPPRKRMGVTSVASVDATSFGFSPSPSQTCGGDSGGPAFLTLGGVEYLVGVTSSGDAQCQMYATDTRADAFRDSLIDPALRAAREGDDELGGCAAAPARHGHGPLPTAALVLVLATALVRSRRRWHRLPRRPPSRTASVARHGVLCQNTISQTIWGRRPVRG